MKKERHPVDDFFKEALQEHQVQISDAGKQRFLDEAATIGINDRRLRWRWLLLLGILAVATSAALIFWFSDGGQLAVGSWQLKV
ncbi:MAG: hypothetical protein IH596_14640 [Bacteroidales bacterium]|nr:hypothetical protein [Bacteroidales bacterium]